MTCEMCGKLDSPLFAEVEGVEMTLCASCAKHGTIKQRPPLPTQRASHQARQEEDIIERVDPQLPVLLREHRRNKGIKQEEFAQKLGIKLSLYQSIESSSRKASMPLAKKLEKELGRSLIQKVMFKPSTTASSGSQGMTIGDMLKR